MDLWVPERGQTDILGVAPQLQKLLRRDRDNDSCPQITSTKRHSMKKILFALATSLFGKYMAKRRNGTTPTNTRRFGR